MALGIVALKTWARQFKFKLDLLRRALISGNAATLIEPTSGAAQPVHIRRAANPGAPSEGAAAAAEAGGGGVDEPDDAADDELDVKRIISVDGDSWYLVEWIVGDTSYEPRENLEGCGDIMVLE